jgi:hypothetical protein
MDSVSYKQGRSAEEETETKSNRAHKDNSGSTKLPLPDTTQLYSLYS